MHIIIGLVLAAFVLWLWLAGHWFGRVLAFLGFGFALMLAGSAAVLRSGMDSVAIELAADAGSLIVAWFIASLPAHFQHRL